MSVRGKLNLHEVMYLIVNKPLVIVRLEHSESTKRLITKALNILWRDRKGQVIFSTLQEFLSEVAPNYELDGNQEGVRRFLLREMEKITTQPTKKGFFTGFFSWGATS